MGAVTRRSGTSPDVRVPWRTLSVVGVVTAVGVAAPFTIGAVGAPLAEDLGIDTGGLGLAVGASFAAMAVASRPVAVRTAALDVRLVMMVACVCVTLALGSLAWVGNVAVLTAVLVVAGIAGSATGPAVARMLAATVSADRLALAQCVVAAGIPASSLLAGLVAGALIEPFGWRFTVLATASVALLMTLIVLPSADVGEPRSASHLSGADGAAGVPTGLLALATALGTSAMSPVAAFFGLHAAAVGLAPGTAGIVLTILASSSIATRIGAGALLPVSSATQFRLAATLVLVGGAGYLAMAGGGIALFIAGAATVFAVGWAFLGVALGATIAAATDPGAAIARVQVGLFAGPAISPVVYGTIFAAHGFEVADGLAAALAASSSVVLWLVAARAPNEAQRSLPRDQNG